MRFNLSVLATYLKDLSKCALDATKQKYEKVTEYKKYRNVVINWEVIWILMGKSGLKTQT